MRKFKISLILTLLIFSIPNIIFAYSNYIIPGGENIGIEIKTKGVMVVGTYDINGNSPAIDAGIKVGDIITKIDDVNIESINDLVNTLQNKKDKVSITLKRNNNLINTELKLVYEDDIAKTGIYVKDNVTGIGTLSYIDPETHLYGALGHEVLESNTGKKLDIKDGKIMSTNVTSIEKSENGIPGSKNATLNKNSIEGIIVKNTSRGIFGKYKEILPNKTKLKVATISDIKLGPAKMLTVTEGNDIKEYTINIIKISKKNNKNILFEVTDEELLNKTGGIVQGMSGSPIIQGDYIIGAVTHVVVDNPKLGYGIFITNMLEEGERD